MAQDPSQPLFVAHAQQVLANGYPVLPIVPSEKRPAVAEWSQLKITPEQVDLWAGRNPNFGIGIRLGSHQRVNLVGIDLDVPDEQVTRALAQWLQQHNLHCPVRIGEAPKAVLLAQSPQQLYRHQSQKWTDGHRSYQVEVLAEGQQIVAFGTHPGTGQPYQWLGADPTTLPASQLPLIHSDDLDALIAEFERLAAGRGWQVQERPNKQSAEVVPLHDDYREPLNVSPGDLREVLSYLSADDYHRWIDVGMALFHETHGEDLGLDLWDEWSQHSGKYPGRDTLARKWRSFRGLGNRGTITARSLYHWAQEEAQKAAEAVQWQQAQGLAARPLRPDDTEGLPARRWVLGTRLLASYLTATFAPGGVSKSMLSIVTAMATATGRPLTGEDVHDPGPAWIINNEDDHQELMRRVEAVRILYGIPWSELDGQLYVNSGYGSPILVATQDARGNVIKHPNVDQVSAEVQQKGIRYVVLDPFVSSHDAEENDNVAINRVADLFKHVAAATGAAVEVIHHTRKGSLGDSEAHAGDAEAGRGASALKDAARVVVTLARMSKDTASKLGLPWSEGRRMVRLDSGKGNFALPDEEVPWFRLESVLLPSGDSVGVPEPFDMTPYTQAEGEEAAEPENLQEQTRLDLVQSVGEPSALQKDVASVLQQQWGVSERQAVRRLEAAVPLGKNRAAVVETFEGEYWVWRERTGGATAPISVHCIGVAESD